MMRFSHAILRFSTMVALTLGIFSAANAQFTQLTVDGSSYPLVGAGFGACGQGTITAEWVIADDGVPVNSNACEPIINDLTGKIALIDRGVCEFGTKCLNAQNAGAITVIVCNNATTAPVSMPPGVDGPQVTIPCYMMSKQNCDVLRLLTPITVEVGPTDNTSVVVWGNEPGEGDFNGGLNGWEVNNISCGNGAMEFELWRWNATGAVTGNAFGDNAISSPTRCNGAMVFTSDAYDNGGDPDMQGAGPCTARQVGELISPAIDLSNTPVPGVSLEFYQVSRQNSSRYFVGYSTDNGMTWTEIEINLDLVVNANPTNSLVRVALPGVVGSSQVRVKFRYDARYYYWAIDDVRLVEQEANNIQVNKDFFAIAQNAATPLVMVEPIHFLADVSNLGASQQSGVNLNVTILKSDNSVVFDEDLLYGDLNGNDTIQNVPFTESYTPDAIDGYTGTYTISGDQEDFDDTNNELSFQFTVTDSTWAKELGQTRVVIPAGSEWEDGEAHTWTYGNHFATPDLGDRQVYATSISFAIDATQDGGAAAGQVPLLVLYQWTDTNNDGNVQPDERVFLAFGAYLVEGTETEDQILTVAFDGNDSILLESNTDYLAMLEYTAPDDVIDLWLGASEAYDYSAMIFVNGPDILARPRFAGMLAIGDLSTAELSSTGFGRDIVPVVRLNASEVITGTKDPLADNNRVEVYPNPVQDILNVEYDLEQTAQNLSIRVMDITGKVVLDRQYSQVKKDKIEFNVKQLAAGTYNVQLTSENGTTTRRFVVAK